MLNEELRARQQFLRTSNELNKGPNVDSYIEGNKQRVEQNRKLEELSINSGMDFSGNVIRQNVLNSSVSTQTSLNNVIDTEIYKEEPKPVETSSVNTNYNSSFASLNNQGRGIINNPTSGLKMNNPTNNLGMNNFANRNNFNNKPF